MLVIGQIMSQLVKKSVSTMYLPLRLASVKLFPEVSVKVVLATAAGIGTSNIVPPPIAAVPEIGGGVVVGMGTLIDASAGAAENATTARTIKAILLCITRCLPWPVMLRS